MSQQSPKPSEAEEASGAAAAASSSASTSTAVLFKPARRRATVNKRSLTPDQDDQPSEKTVEAVSSSKCNPFDLIGQFANRSFYLHILLFIITL